MAKAAGGNLALWDKVSVTPDTAKKSITGGRLKGMTDISPQYRYKVMTEVYGPIGVGWKYTIDEIEHFASGTEILVRIRISLYTRLGQHENGETNWSAAIPGIGGNKLVADERNGPYACDDAWSMAETDALGKAMKKLGVCSDVYESGYSKYQAPQSGGAPRSGQSPPPATKSALDQLAIGTQKTVTTSIKETKIVWDSGEDPPKKQLMIVKTDKGNEVSTFSKKLQKIADAEAGKGTDVSLTFEIKEVKGERRLELKNLIPVKPEPEEGELKYEDTEQTTDIGGETTETPF